MPSMVGRSKKQLFGYLRDRVWRKIHHWSGRHLSKAGREVLVKSVAQAIPAYCMSTFLIPTTLGEEMERMINSFWWGSNRSSRRGINWLNWDKLTMRKEFGGMGFRHFHGFNLAMLGKQGWRLCNNHDAIVTRVFKAKYFPNGNFLGARLGHNPSYVWRSIHSSQVLVKFGARWKIGDGTNINIWREPWVRGGANSFISSPIVAGTEDWTVSMLFDPHSGRWHEHQLQQLFSIEDQQRICSLILRCRDHADSLIWNPSRDGFYSVRSGYYVAMNVLIDSSNLRIAGDWNLLWKLHVPSKVKIHLWRIARGVLPCRRNLRRRRVQCPEECPMCDAEVEDERHLFFDCPRAEEVWRSSGLWSELQPVLLEGDSYSVSFFKILTMLQGASRTCFAMLLWCLWKRRNEKVWENVSKPLRLSIQNALDMLFSWQQARHSKFSTQEPTSARRNNEAVSWVRPAAGIVKCNVDAALFDDGRYGIGMCIRNDEGAFVKARTVWYNGHPQPQEAEALGLLEAVTWLQALNVQRVTIELDCKAVVDGVRGSSKVVTEYGSILNVCQSLLSALENYTVSFIRRQANVVAHTLARAATSYASSHVFDCIPTCISSLLINEMI